MPSTHLGDTPYSIAIAANNKALFTTTTYPSYTGYSSRVMELDLSTWAVRERTDIVASTTEATYLAASGDRRRIFAVTGNVSSGYVWAYDASTDRRSADRGLGDFVGYIAASWRGDRVVAAPHDAVMDGSLNVLRELAPQSFGIAVSPLGDTLYRGHAAGVDLVDLGTGTVRGFRPLGDTIDTALSSNYIRTPVARMTLEPSGTVLVVMTDDGFSVVPVARQPVTVPPEPPPTATPTPTPPTATPSPTPTTTASATSPVGDRPGAPRRRAGRRPGPGRVGIGAGDLGPAPRREDAARELALCAGSAATPPAPGAPIRAMRARPTVSARATRAGASARSPTA